MPESAHHMRLVEALVQWTTKYACNTVDAILLVDSPHSDKFQKPPSIMGFNPDLYWRTLSGGNVIVGEAKPAYDVESRHSRKQYSAYLSYLGRIEKSILLIACPWHTINQGRSLMRSIQRETETLHVSVVFIEQLPG